MLLNLDSENWKEFRVIGVSKTFTVRQLIWLSSLWNTKIILWHQDTTTTAITKVLLSRREKRSTPLVLLTNSDGLKIPWFAHWRFLYLHTGRRGCLTCIQLWKRSLRWLYSLWGKPLSWAHLTLPLHETDQLLPLLFQQHQMLHLQTLMLRFWLVYLTYPVTLTPTQKTYAGPNITSSDTVIIETPTQQGLFEH